ncbi:hypothetical protein D3C79_577620 [compost metagenome]
MLQRNELEDLGLVAAGFQVQRAQAVSEHFSLLAQVQSVLQHWLEQARAVQLRANLLVAARRAHDDRRAATNTGVDRVISGDITGMQCNHHLDGAGHHAAHITAFEHQARMLQTRGRGVAQLDHVRAQLDAGHLRLALQGIAQVVVHGKGQVTLARTKIGHSQRLLGG